jgi:hypothetical protein
MAEDPGGSVGCDVCGALVAADEATLHNELHPLKTNGLRACRERFAN